MNSESEHTARELIASNIKCFRKNKGMTVQEVGEAVGRSAKTISAWEVCVGQPDADMLIKLCRLFEVEISDFFNENPLASGVIESDLSNDESYIIYMYRNMSQPSKNVAMATIEALYTSFGCTGQ